MSWVPERYEEMARAWLTKKYGRIDSFSYQGGPTACVGCMARREPDRLAVPEGELAEQREKLWTLIRNYRVEHVGDLVGVAGAIDRILEPLFEMASAWARLQWRKASEAPRGVRVLFVGNHEGLRAFVCIGERHEEGQVWLDEDTSNNGGMRIAWRNDEVLGWLPLDALPSVPPTPGASDG